jgi:DNA polymerase III subunit epsilon
MYLLFDTETTGLPKNWKAPLQDLGNWPRLVQIAWVEIDNFGKTISSGNYIIKPEGFLIPDSVAKIHRITQSRAEREGISLKNVLNVFNSLIDKSTYIVAHNISFDEKIVGAEFLREYIPTKFSSKKQICTMKSSVDFAKIPSNKGGYRYPSLSALYRKLFNETLQDAHDAAVDIAATARIFWELKKLGVINPEKKESKEKEFPDNKKENTSELSLF